MHDTFNRAHEGDFAQEQAIMYCHIKSYDLGKESNLLLRSFENELRRPLPEVLKLSAWRRRPKNASVSELASSSESFWPRKAQLTWTQGPFFCEHGYHITIKWGNEARDGPKAKTPRGSPGDPYITFPTLMSHTQWPEDVMMSRRPHHQNNQGRPVLSFVSMTISKLTMGN